MTDRAPGRPRDPEIEARVLAVARHHLATIGYPAMSLVAIAQEAGTTRQALYRRWASKADLATAAIAALAREIQPASTGEPWADLVRELEAFEQGIGRPDGIGMVGAMLSESTDPKLVELFRQRLVAPRRERFRAILDNARASGLLEHRADIEVALSMLTGSWYANALTGHPPPDHWADRVASLVWRSLGGRPPDRRG